MKALRVNFIYRFSDIAMTKKSDISIDKKENSLKHIIRQPLLCLLKNINFKSFICIVVILFTACKESTDYNKIEKQLLNKEKNKIAYQLETVKSGNVWGYCIKKDNKTIISQTHIPSIKGINYFQSEKDAKKVGNLMLFKINNGIFPPSISKEELDSLSIKY